MYSRAREFMAGARVFMLDRPVTEKTIDLRRKHRVALPDAIIAAAAIVHGLSLVTADVSDFEHLGIKIVELPAQT